MSKEPWYKDGLQFTCTQCGDCCTGDPGVVWVNEEELAALAAHLGKSVGEVKLEHTRLFANRLSLKEFPNGDCTFLDPTTRKCRVYPVRPRQCKTWPFWNSNIATPEAWEEAKRVCPGTGQGNFVSLDEIRRQASIIDI